MSLNIDAKSTLIGGAAALALASVFGGSTKKTTAPLSGLAGTKSRKKSTSTKKASTAKKAGTSTKKRTTKRK